MKTHYAAQYSEQNDWSNYCITAAVNNKTVHNVVKTANENQKKLFFWNSIKSVNKSDACSLKKEKLCDFSTFIEYYKCF